MYWRRQLRRPARVIAAPSIVPWDRASRAWADRGRSCGQERRIDQGLVARTLRKGEVMVSVTVRIPGIGGQIEARKAAIARAVAWQFNEAMAARAAAPVARARQASSGDLGRIK